MRPSLKTRIASAVTLFFFAFTNLAPSGFAGINFSSAEKVPVSKTELLLPNELGRVEETHLSSEGSPVVFHIEAAHGDVGIQKRIKEILRHLHKTQGVRLVFAEGAAEKLKPEFLRFFPDTSLNDQMAELLLEKGLYTGMDLFLLDPASKGIAGVGIEKSRLYRAAYQAFTQVLQDSPTVETFLREKEMQLDREAQTVLSKNLMEIVKKHQKFEDHPFPFLAYSNFLLKAANQFLQMDFKSPFLQLDWPGLVRLALVQQFEKELNREKLAEEKKKIDSTFGVLNVAEAESPRSFFERFLHKVLPRGFRFSDYPHFSRWVGLQVLQSELDARTLSGEVEKLRKMLEDSLERTKKDRLILKRYEELLLLKKLLRLELNRKEWDSIRNRVKIGKGFPSVMTSALRFYRLVERRDQVFFDTLRHEMKARGEKKALLVTGGFHTEGLTRLFRKNGFSYAVVSPHVAEEVSTDVYRKAMVGLSQMEITEMAQRAEVRAVQGRRLKVEKEWIQDAFKSIASKNGIEDWPSALRRTPYWQDLAAYSSYLPRAEVRTGKGENEQPKFFPIKRIKHHDLILDRLRKGRPFDVLINADPHDDLYAWMSIGAGLQRPQKPQEREKLRIQDPVEREAVWAGKALRKGWVRYYVQIPPKDDNLEETHPKIWTLRGGKEGKKIEEITPDIFEQELKKLGPHDSLRTLLTVDADYYWLEEYGNLIYNPRYSLQGFDERTLPVIDFLAQHDLELKSPIYLSDSTGDWTHPHWLPEEVGEPQLEALRDYLGKRFAKKTGASYLKIKKEERRAEVRTDEMGTLDVLKKETARYLSQIQLSMKEKPWEVYAVASVKGNTLEEIHGGFNWMVKLLRKGYEKAQENPTDSQKWELVHRAATETAMILKALSDLKSGRLKFSKERELHKGTGKFRWSYGFEWEGKNDYDLLESASWPAEEDSPVRFELSIFYPKAENLGKTRTVDKKAAQILIELRTRDRPQPVAVFVPPRSVQQLLEFRHQPAPYNRPFFFLNVLSGKKDSFIDFAKNLHDGFSVFERAEVRTEEKEEQPPSKTELVVRLPSGAWELRPGGRIEVSVPGSKARIFLTLQKTFKDLKWGKQARFLISAPPSITIVHNKMPDRELAWEVMQYLNQKNLKSGNRGRTRRGKPFDLDFSKQILIHDLFQNGKSVTLELEIDTDKGFVRLITQTQIAISRAEVRSADWPSTPPSSRRSAARAEVRARERLEKMVAHEMEMRRGLFPSDTWKAEKIAELFLPYADLEDGEIQGMIRNGFNQQPSVWNSNFELRETELQTLRLVVRQLIREGTPEMTVTTLGPGLWGKELTETLEVVLAELEKTKDQPKIHLLLRAVNPGIESLLDLDEKMKNTLSDLPKKIRSKMDVDYQGIYGEILNLPAHSEFLVPSHIYFWRNTWAGVHWSVDSIQEAGRKLWTQLKIPGALILWEREISVPGQGRQSMEVQNIKRTDRDPFPPALESRAEVRSPSREAIRIIRSIQNVIREREMMEEKIDFAMEGEKARRKKFDLFTLAFVMALPIKSALGWRLRERLKLSREEDEKEWEELWKAMDAADRLFNSDPPLAPPLRAQLRIAKAKALIHLAEYHKVGPALFYPAIFHSEVPEGERWALLGRLNLHRLFREQKRREQKELYGKGFEKIEASRINLAFNHLLAYSFLVIKTPATGFSSSASRDKVIRDLFGFIVNATGFSVSRRQKKLLENAFAPVEIPRSFKESALTYRESEFTQNNPVIANLAQVSAVLSAKTISRSILNSDRAKALVLQSQEIRKGLKAKGERIWLPAGIEGEIKKTPRAEVRTGGTEAQAAAQAEALRAKFSFADMTQKEKEGFETYRAAIKEARRLGTIRNVLFLFSAASLSLLTMSPVFSIPTLLFALGAAFFALLIWDNRNRTRENRETLKSLEREYTKILALESAFGKWVRDYQDWRTQWYAKRNRGLVFDEEDVKKAQELVKRWQEVFHLASFLGNVEVPSPYLKERSKEFFRAFRQSGRVHEVVEMLKDFLTVTSRLKSGERSHFQNFEQVDPESLDLEELIKDLRKRFKDLLLMANGYLNKKSFRVQQKGSTVLEDMMKEAEEGIAEIVNAETNELAYERIKEVWDRFMKRSRKDFLYSTALEEIQEHLSALDPLLFDFATSRAEVRSLLSSGETLTGEDTLYQIQEVIKKNRVFRAEDLKNRRQVVVKAYPPKFHERWAQELQLLNHDFGPSQIYFPKFYETGGDPEKYQWITMENIEGQNLKEWSQGKSPQEILNLFEEVLKAVQVLHEHGFIHHDLKPGSILVTPQGQVKILDFDSSVPLGSKMLGLTPRYAAPEVLLGDLPTFAYDIFSLGIVLMELITGRFDILYPKEELTLRGLILFHRTSNMPDPQQIAAKLPDEWRPFTKISEIIAKAVSSDPTGRYQNAKQMGEDITVFQRHPEAARLTRERNYFLELLHILNGYHWLIEEKRFSPKWLLPDWPDEVEYEGYHDKSELGFRFHFSFPHFGWNPDPSAVFEWDGPTFEKKKLIVRDIINDRISKGYLNNEEMHSSGRARRLFDLLKTLDIQIHPPYDSQGQKILETEPFNVFSPALYPRDAVLDIASHYGWSRPSLVFQAADFLTRWSAILPPGLRFGIFYSAKWWANFLKSQGVRPWAAGFARSNSRGHFVYFLGDYVTPGLVLHEFVHILQNVASFSRHSLFENLKGWFWKIKSDALSHTLYQWEKAISNRYEAWELSQEFGARFYQQLFEREKDPLSQALGSKEAETLKDEILLTWETMKKFIQALFDMKDGGVKAEILSSLRRYYLSMHPLIPLPKALEHIPGVDDSFVFPEAGWPEKSPSDEKGKKRADEILAKLKMNSKTAKALNETLNRKPSFDWGYKEEGVREKTIWPSEEGLEGFLKAFQRIRTSGIVGQWSLAFHAMNQDGRGDVLAYFNSLLEGLSDLRPVQEELEALRDGVAPTADLGARIQRDLEAIGFMKEVKTYLQKMASPSSPPIKPRAEVRSKKESGSSDSWQDVMKNLTGVFYYPAAGFGDQDFLKRLEFLPKVKRVVLNDFEYNEATFEKVLKQSGLQIISGKKGHYRVKYQPYGKPAREFELSLIGGDAFEVNPLKALPPDAGGIDYVYFHGTGIFGELTTHPRFQAKHIKELNIGGVLEISEYGSLPMEFLDPYFNLIGLRFIGFQESEGVGSAHGYFFQKVSEVDTKRLEELIRLDFALRMYTDYYFKRAFLSNQKDAVELSWDAAYTRGAVEALLNFQKVLPSDVTKLVEKEIRGTIRQGIKKTGGRIPRAFKRWFEGKDTRILSPDPQAFLDQIKEALIGKFEQQVDTRKYINDPVYRALKKLPAAEQLTRRHVKILWDLIKDKTELQNHLDVQKRDQLIVKLGMKGNLHSLEEDSTTETKLDHILREAKNAMERRAWNELLDWIRLFDDLDIPEGEKKEAGIQARINQINALRTIAFTASSLSYLVHKRDLDYFMLNYEKQFLPWRALELSESLRHAKPALEKDLPALVRDEEATAMALLDFEGRFGSAGKEASTFIHQAQIRDSHRWGLLALLDAKNIQHYRQHQATEGTLQPLKDVSEEYRSQVILLSRNAFAHWFAMMNHPASDFQSIRSRAEWIQDTLTIFMELPTNWDPHFREVDTGKMASLLEAFADSFETIPKELQDQMRAQSDTALFNVAWISVCLMAVLSNVFGLQTEASSFQELAEAYSEALRQEHDKHPDYKPWTPPQLIQLEKRIGMQRPGSSPLDEDNTTRAEVRRNPIDSGTTLHVRSAGRTPSTEARAEVRGGLSMEEVVNGFLGTMEKYATFKEDRFLSRRRILANAHLLVNQLESSGAKLKESAPFNKLVQESLKRFQAVLERAYQNLNFTPEEKTELDSLPSRFSELLRPAAPAPEKKKEEKEKKGEKARRGFDLVRTADFMIQQFKETGKFPSQAEITRYVDRQEKAVQKRYGALLSTLRARMMEMKLDKTLRQGLEEAIQGKERLAEAIRTGEPRAPTKPTRPKRKRTEVVEAAVLLLIELFKREQNRKRLPSFEEMAQQLTAQGMPVVRSWISLLFPAIEKRLEEIIQAPGFNARLRERIELAIEIRRNLPLAIAQYTLRKFREEEDRRLLFKREELVQIFDLSKNTIDRSYRPARKILRLDLKKQNIPLEMKERLREALERYPIFPRAEVPSAAPPRTPPSSGPTGRRAEVRTEEPHFENSTSFIWEIQVVRFPYAAAAQAILSLPRMTRQALQTAMRIPEFFIPIEFPDQTVGRLDSETVNQLVAKPRRFSILISGWTYHLTPKGVFISRGNRSFLSHDKTLIDFLKNYFFKILIDFSTILVEMKPGTADEAVLKDFVEKPVLQRVDFKKKRINVYNPDGSVFRIFRSDGHIVDSLEKGLEKSVYPTPKFLQEDATLRAKFAYVHSQQLTHQDYLKRPVLRLPGPDETDWRKRAEVRSEEEIGRLFKTWEGHRKQVTEWMTGQTEQFMNRKDNRQYAISYYAVFEGAYQIRLLLMITAEAENQIALGLTASVYRRDLQELSALEKEWIGKYQVRLINQTSKAEGFKTFDGSSNAMIARFDSEEDNSLLQYKLLPHYDIFFSPRAEVRSSIFDGMKQKLSEQLNISLGAKFSSKTKEKNRNALFHALLKEQNLSTEASVIKIFKEAGLQAYIDKNKAGRVISAAAQIKADAVKNVAGWQEVRDILGSSAISSIAADLKKLRVRLSDMSFLMSLYEDVSEIDHARQTMVSKFRLKKELVPQDLFNDFPEPVRKALLEKLDLKGRVLGAMYSEITLPGIVHIQQKEPLMSADQAMALLESLGLGAAKKQVRALIKDPEAQLLEKAHEQNWKDFQEFFQDGVRFHIPFMAMHEALNRIIDEVAPQTDKSLSLQEKIEMIYQHHLVAYAKLMEAHGEKLWNPEKGEFTYTLSRLENVMEFINRVRKVLKPGTRFADLGSGDGAVVHWVRLLTGAEAAGFEIRDYLMDEARKITAELVSKNVFPDETGIEWKNEDYLSPTSNLSLYDVLFIFPPKRRQASGAGEKSRQETPSQPAQEASGIIHMTLPEPVTDAKPAVSFLEIAKKMKPGALLYVYGSPSSEVMAEEGTRNFLEYDPGLSAYRSITATRAEVRAGDKEHVWPMLRRETGVYTNLVADLEELNRLYPDSSAKGFLLQAISHYRKYAAADPRIQAMIEFEDNFEVAKKALYEFYRQTPLVEMALPPEIQIHQRSFKALDNSRVPMKPEWDSRARQLKREYHFSHNTYRIKINSRDYQLGQGQYLEFEYPNGQSDFIYDHHNLLYAFAAQKGPGIQNRHYVNYDDRADSLPEEEPMPSDLHDLFEKAQYYHINNFHQGILRDSFLKNQGWKWTWVSHRWMEPDEQDKALYDEILDFSKTQPAENGGVASIDLDIISRGSGELLTYQDTLALYQEDRPALIRQLPHYEMRAFFISAEHFIKPAAALRIFGDLYPEVVQQRLSQMSSPRAEVRIEVWEPERHLRDESFRKSLFGSLRVLLDTPERKVLEEQYPLTGPQTKTMKRIAEELGVSRNQAYLYEKSALSKAKYFYEHFYAQPITGDSQRDSIWKVGYLKDSTQAAISALGIQTIADLEARIRKPSLRQGFTRSQVWELQTAWARYDVFRQASFDMGASRRAEVRTEESIEPYPDGERFRKLLIRYEARPQPIARELGVGKKTVIQWMETPLFKELANELRQARSPAAVNHRKFLGLVQEIEGLTQRLNQLIAQRQDREARDLFARIYQLLEKAWSVAQKEPSQRKERVRRIHSLEEALKDATDYLSRWTKKKIPHEEEKQGKGRAEVRSDIEGFPSFFNNPQFVSEFLKEGGLTPLQRRTLEHRLEGKSWRKIVEARGQGSHQRVGQLLDRIKVMGNEFKIYQILRALVHQFEAHGILEITPSLIESEFFTQAGVRVPITDSSLNRFINRFNRRNQEFRLTKTDSTHRYRIERRAEVRRGIEDLYEDVNVRYFKTIKDLFFGHIEHPAVLVPSSGSDISSILLLTNATKALFVDKLPFGDSITSLAPERIDEYFRMKKEWTWSSGPMLQEAGNIRTFLLEELRRIGAVFNPDEDIKRDPEEANIYRVHFKWGYPGETAKDRELIFIGSKNAETITGADIQNRVPGLKLDGIVIKALEYTRLGVGNKNLGKFVTQVLPSIKGGGHIVVDAALEGSPENVVLLDNPSLRELEKEGAQFGYGPEFSYAFPKIKKGAYIYQLLSKQSEGRAEVRMVGSEKGISVNASFSGQARGQPPPLWQDRIRPSKQRARRYSTSDSPPTTALSGEQATYANPYNNTTSIPTPTLPLKGIEVENQKDRSPAPNVSSASLNNDLEKSNRRMPPTVPKPSAGVNINFHKYIDNNLNSKEEPDSAKGQEAITFEKLKLAEATGGVFPIEAREKLIRYLVALRRAYREREVALIPDYLKEAIEEFRSRGIPMEASAKEVGAEVLIYDHVPTESETAAVIFSLARKPRSRAQMIVVSDREVPADDLNHIRGAKDIQGHAIGERFQLFQARKIGELKKEFPSLLNQLTAWISSQVSNESKEKGEGLTLAIRKRIVVTMEEGLAEWLGREVPEVLNLLYYGIRRIHYQRAEQTFQYSALQTAALSLSEKDYEKLTKFEQRVLEDRGQGLFVSRYSGIEGEWQAAWIAAESKILQAFARAA